MGGCYKHPILAGGCKYCHEVIAQEFREMRPSHQANCAESGAGPGNMVSIGCCGCPLAGDEFNSREQLRCYAASRWIEPWEMSEDSDIEMPPPEWCPLREGPIVVRLAGCTKGLKHRGNSYCSSSWHFGCHTCGDQAPGRPGWEGGNDDCNS